MLKFWKKKPPVEETAAQLAPIETEIPATELATPVAQSTVEPALEASSDASPMP